MRSASRARSLSNVLRCSRGTPTVALEDHGRPDHPEVDLVPADDRMELDRWESVPVDEPLHGGLEQRVGRFAVDRPGVDGVAQRHDPGPPACGVLDDDRLERRQRDVVVGDGVPDGIGHGGTIDRAEIQQRPKDVGA
jgi:hypothetical protein